MLFSGPWGKLIHEKNLKQKISWHYPFKFLPSQGSHGKERLKETVFQENRCKFKNCNPNKIAIKRSFFSFLNELKCKLAYRTVHTVLTSTADQQPSSEDLEWWFKPYETDAKRYI